MDRFRRSGSRRWPASSASRISPSPPCWKRSSPAGCSIATPPWAERSARRSSWASACCGPWTPRTNMVQLAESARRTGPDAALSAERQRLGRRPGLDQLFHAPGPGESGCTSVATGSDVRFGSGSLAQLLGNAATRSRPMKSSIIWRSYWSPCRWPPTFALSSIETMNQAGSSRDQRLQQTLHLLGSLPEFQLA